MRTDLTDKEADAICAITCDVCGGVNGHQEIFEEVPVYLNEPHRAPVGVQMCYKANEKDEDYYGD